MLIVSLSTWALPQKMQVFTREAKPADLKRLPCSLTHHWDKESEWHEPGTKSGKPVASSAPVTSEHKGVVGHEKTQQILKH